MIRYKNLMHVFIFACINIDMHYIQILYFKTITALRTIGFFRQDVHLFGTLSKFDPIYIFITNVKNRLSHNIVFNTYISIVQSSPDIPATTSMLYTPC
jgi:hypothetical protein